jgi:hypothetical protein
MVTFIVRASHRFDASTKEITEGSRALNLKAIVLIPKAVKQIPTIGQAAKKKCKERELLKLAYWKINRPK